MFSTKLWFQMNKDRYISQNGHAVAIRFEDGSFRILSNKSCHSGIKVNSSREVDAALRFLKRAHKNQQKLCNC